MESRKLLQFLRPGFPIHMVIIKRWWYLAFLVVPGISIGAEPPAREPIPEVRTVALAQGKKYRALSVNGGNIGTFALPGRSPGVVAVNRQLWDLLLAGVDSEAGCAPEAKEQAENGEPPPTYTSDVTPLFWSDRWLSVMNLISGSCGTQEFHDFNVKTWDLRSGTLINPWSWIAGSAKVAAPSTSYVDYEIPPALQRLVAAKAVAARLAIFPNEASEVDGCIPQLREATDYEISIGQYGLVFWHKFPWASKACEDHVQVSYRALQPFLTALGRQNANDVLGSARASRRQIR